MGIQAVAVARTFDKTALERLDSPPTPNGDLDEAGGSQRWGYLIDPAANATALAVNRLLAAAR